MIIKMNLNTKNKFFTEDKQVVALQIDQDDFFDKGQEMLLEITEALNDDEILFEKEDSSTHLSYYNELVDKIKK